MYPLKHYGFLFGFSSSEPSRTPAEGEEDSGNQKDSKPPAEEQKETLTISSEVNSACLGQVEALCTKGEAILLMTVYE